VLRLDGREKKEEEESSFLCICKRPAGICGPELLLHHGGGKEEEKREKGLDYLSCLLRQEGSSNRNRGLRVDVDLVGLGGRKEGGNLSLQLLGQVEGQGGFPRPLHTFLKASREEGRGGKKEKEEKRD